MRIAVSAINQARAEEINQLNCPIEKSRLKMVLLRRRIACCTWNREIINSIDFDQSPKGIMTYNGLENCILNANSCDNESECPTDSIDEDDSSCSSSSKSVSSHWAMIKRDEKKELYDSESQKKSVIKEKVSEVEIMKEKFAKLLLGEDSTGGSKGHSSAFALSNSITKLAGSVFGELWKLEPLSDEKKIKWKNEMEWLLAPTNYMVELVLAKQFDANGRTLEIMKPKAREDVHMNLPALKKLDSMLLETLDAMKNTEFWYEEEGKNTSLKESKKWWVPVPQVPEGGLSDCQRKKLANHAKLVNQIFKAAKSINETILLEMPMPKIILEALPKSGKASLGDDLYKTLNTISCSDVGMLNSLNLKSDHNALDTINRLEAAIHAWKERILMQTNTKSQARTSWSLKDPSMEIDKIQFFINRAQVLLQQIRMRYPNLPKTFLDVMKIQYGKDIAHAILESYSRVLGNLAFNILTRINDICKEDVSVPGISARHEMNNIQGKLSLLETEKLSLISDETRTKSVTTTPNRSPRFCFTPPKWSP